MLKVILDTNMYLSAFVYGGMVEGIVDCIAEDKLHLFISPNLTAEILKKFKEKNASKETMKKVTVLLQYKGILTQPTVRVTACRDPKDNFVLELAETAQADYLITRDKDLLYLPGKRWKTTKITKPETFLPLLRKMNFL